MGHTPLVSIIVPVYNAKNHLARCIESIRAQTYKHIEIILVNDGSSDISLELCNIYKNADSRITVIDKDNAGVSDTRNRGIENAAGEYLQFVDSDDYLAPDYTENLVATAERNHADLVIAHYYMVIPKAMAPIKELQPLMEMADRVREKAGEEKPAEPEPEIRVNGFLKEGVLDKNGFALHLLDQPAAFYYGVMWNKLYRREIILEHGLRCWSELSWKEGFLGLDLKGSRELNWSEDFLFNLNYIRYAEAFAVTEKPGYYYVQNPSSLCHTKVNVASAVSTKVTLYGYYYDLYKSLGLVGENRLKTLKYLFGIAESTQPTSPLKKSIEETLQELAGTDADAGAEHARILHAVGHVPQSERQVPNNKQSFWLREQPNLVAPKLKAGDVIGIVSPSSPATANKPHRWQRAQAFLRAAGFRVRTGSLTGKKDFYRSGTIAQRAAELNEMIRDPEVRCIMTSIGGMNSNAILPYLDYKALEADPKIIVGYSDATALLLGIYARTGLVTYYGPAAVASLGEFPPIVGETWQYFMDVTCENAAFPHKLPTPAAWTEEYLDWEAQDRAKALTENHLVTVVEGRAEGRLIGGNLNTMAGIWATKYMPEIRTGDILFIEDCLKDAATVERSFAHLKLAGVFDHIGGLVLGKHECFDDMGTGRRPYEILMEVVGKAEFPILAEFDCCHTHPMLTLPLGCVAELDATAQTLTIVHE